MIDRILRIGASFDWISPLLSVAQDIANGPSHTFLIPVTCGWTGRELANLLRSHGIKTWGHMIVNDTFMISVRQTQARWAQYLLDREGVPTEGAAVVSQSGGRSEPRPAETGRTESLADELRDIGNLHISL